MATCADITSFELPDAAAEDSISFLPELLGEQGHSPLRQITLHQTISLAMGIRHGDWKYLDHRGSGGSNYTRAGEWGMKPYALDELEPEAPGQLYHLGDDPGETRNLYFRQPVMRDILKSKLDAFIRSGRSR